MGLGFLDVLTRSGGAWVIWMLLLSSVWVAAVMVEKWLILKREREDFFSAREALSSALGAGDLAAAAKAASGGRGAAVRILSAGLSRPGNAAALEERLVSARLLEKKGLEMRLIILGTMGNNAPFIGLFGTVLGIIKAFQDLAFSGSAGPEVVMHGLAEALIATAVGIMVAIPSVVGYNLFHKIIADLLAETDALSRLLMAAVKEKDGRGA